jgi:propionyl-CoA synthetase
LSDSFGCFGGFAPHELAIHIDDCKPRAIITASSGIEVDRLIAYKPLVDEAIALASHRPKVIVFNRKLGARIPFKKYDVDYDALVYGSGETPCVALPSNHPLYILHIWNYRKTKGIVRDTGICRCTQIFDETYLQRKDEVFGQPLIWVGQWAQLHLYGPLINRNTTIVFEGKPIKTPDASTFWRIISDIK